MLSSWIWFHNYGPAMAAAVGEAVNTSPIASLTAEGKLSAVGTVSPTASATINDGREITAIDTSVNSSPVAQLTAKGTISAVGKVNELSQDDVTGAVLEAVVEDGVTLKEALRLLLAVAQGDAQNLNTNPIYKSLDGSKTRVAGTVSGGTRTITTRNGT